MGDALGTTLEFSRRDSLPRQTEITGGGPFRLAPGVWTDDTSMALALAESLAAHPGLDERNLMDRFVAWWRRGEYSPAGRCFDIGGTTRAALARYERTGDPLAGDPSPHAAGNGSLMRLAPAVLADLGDRAVAVEAARRSSAVTHAAPNCLDACAYFAGLLWDTIHGADKAAVLAARDWPGEPAIRVLAAGAWQDKPREEIESSGYVMHTLEAALWCVHRAGSFEEAVVEAVNLGDDADTVGAVTGQLAGALWGLAGIPSRWLDRLAWRERLLAAADALLARA